jgi:hypothetical protein
MGIAEIIALLSLLVAIVALFLKSRADRISLEVRIAEVSRDMVALNEKVNTGFIQRNELIEGIRLSTTTMINSLAEQLHCNNTINREDHDHISKKIDDLKDLLIKISVGTKIK